MKQKKQVKKVAKKHESGRSMIEMVGVLAVMGLITAAAFILITSAMRSQKLSRADDDVAALAAGVRLLYNNNTNFTGLSDTALDVLGFDNAKVTTPYGGGYSLGVGTEREQDDRFYISMTTDSDSTCAALANRTWGSGGKGKCNGSELKIWFGKDGVEVSADAIN